MTRTASEFVKAHFATRHPWQIVGASSPANIEKKIHGKMAAHPSTLFSSALVVFSWALQLLPPWLYFGSVQHGLSKCPQQMIGRKDKLAQHD